jgi:hypothetical protein
MGTTGSQISKETRTALRAALKSQLAVVRKKVRTMRAKSLLGEKDDDSQPDEKKETKNVVASVADGKSGGSGNPPGSEARGAGAEKAAGEGGDGGSGGLTPELKSEAMEFFQKGNRPKTGKTRSVIAQVMTNEQRIFSRNSKHQPSDKKGGKRK